MGRIFHSVVDIKRTDLPLVRQNCVTKKMFSIYFPNNVLINHALSAREISLDTQWLDNLQSLPILSHCVKLG